MTNSLVVSRQVGQPVASQNHHYVQINDTENNDPDTVEVSAFCHDSTIGMHHFFVFYTPVGEEKQEKMSIPFC